VGQIGAGRYERSDESTTSRNGGSDRVLDTRLGSLQLHIPKLRQGSYFSPFLEAQKVSEKALIGVIHKDLIGWVSTRRVDEPGGRWGRRGLCKDIDERVHGCRERPLARKWPYLWLDATF